jgi:hypothetical protein
MSVWSQNLGKKCHAGNLRFAKTAVYFCQNLATGGTKLFSNGFAADGHRTVKFFDEKAGATGIDFLLSRINQYIVNYILS